jgi:antitoxin VapB
MALSIRNKRAEELARKAARASGKSMTEVIIDALETKLADLESHPASDADLERIMSISRRCSELPTLDNRPDEVILGYDEAVNSGD